MRYKDIKILVVIGATIALMVAVARGCQGQTICVETVLSGPAVKAQVENWIQEKGFQTGCPAPWELVVEPLSGRVPIDQTYFVSSFSTVPGVVVGTVSTRRSSIPFASWIVGIHLQNQPLMGTQTLGYSLRGGVRKVLRTVSKDGRK